MSKRPAGGFQFDVQNKRPRNNPGGIFPFGRQQPVWQQQSGHPTVLQPNRGTSPYFQSRSVSGEFPPPTVPHTNFTPDVYKEPSVASPAGKPSRPPLKPLRVLTGTVEKIVTSWSRVARNEPILYEVVGKVDTVRSNLAIPCLKKFFLMDPMSSSGPQLSVDFYEIDRKMIEINIGDLVKVVGIMRGRTLQAFLVVKSSEAELAALQRVIHVCDRTVADISRVS